MSCFCVSTAIVTHIRRKMYHVFGVSTVTVTHIPRKMCHFFGVSTGLVTHIPVKMCHVFVGSGRRLRCLEEKGCRGGLGGLKEGEAGRPGWRGWGLVWGRGLRASGGGREAACERGQGERRGGERAWGWGGSGEA